MKFNRLITVFFIISLRIYFINYHYFIFNLAFTWSVASVLILYIALKYSHKYNFLQFKLKKILSVFRIKNNLASFASLCISLAAKIGVGSLSGVALAIYYGGVGTMFWLVIISLFVSINAFLECKLGIKYRTRINNLWIGGPSYYMAYGLKNTYLSKFYSLIIIITYSFLFLSIQTNTIVNTGIYFDIKPIYSITILALITLLIIFNGLKGISRVNTYLVPGMLLIYLGIGIYIFINYFRVIPNIIVLVIKEAFNYKTLLSVFLISMQRAIFITESSIGTSAIAASTCGRSDDKQGLFEIFGIYVVIFIVCLTTFIIIVTSDYQTVSFMHINGIEIVLYAFKYHFGTKGSILLSIITILFAFSTIIASYFFGESNLLVFTKKHLFLWLFKFFFILFIIISGYLKADMLWNLTDYFVALLTIINIYALIKIGD